MTDQPTDLPMNPLQRLIRSRMLEMRCSYGDIARRGGLPRSTVHYVATHNHPARLPHPATLERLAVGLDLPVGVLRAAAASAAGLVLGTEQVGDPEIEVLIASLSQLSPEDRKHVAALVRSLLGATSPAT